ncbi:hypothetical protein D3C75_292730 [compost metagenome]
MTSKITSTLPTEVIPASEDKKSRGFNVFIFSLSTNFLFLLALYNAVISVFIPNQVQQITDASGGSKVAALALIFTLMSVFTFFDQPLAGALSDRTRSRFGRRTPWLVGGTWRYGSGDGGSPDHHPRFDAVLGDRCGCVKCRPGADVSDDARPGRT